MTLCKGEISNHPHIYGSETAWSKTPGHPA